MNRNFHTLLEGQDASTLDVMFLVESLRTGHHLKEKPLYSLLKEVLKHKDVLEAEGTPCSKTIRNKLQKKLVGVTLTFEFQNKETGRVRKFNGFASIPRKMFGRSKWQLIYTLAKVTFS